MQSRKFGVARTKNSRYAAEPAERDLFRVSLKKLPREKAAREKLIAAAVSNMPVPKPPSKRPVKIQPGYRYRGYFFVGAVLTASVDIGSMAEEGARGVVFQVIDRGHDEIYGVIFETGQWDWFPPEDVDNYLAGTGLTATGAADYRYRNEQQLLADFKTGLFEFWPQ